MKSWVFVFAALWACGESAPTPKQNTAPSTAATDTQSPAPAGATAPAAPARIVLADEPALDLIDNRYLWHLGGPAQMFLPLASEGIRKYSHEYSRPWQGNLRLDGEVGRVLANRQATLRFGWFDSAGPALLRLRVHGMVAGQRVTIELNGKTLKSSSLEPSWQVLEVEVPGGALVSGENEIKLHLAKASTSGGSKSYALWHSLAIALDDAPALDIAQARLQPALQSDAGGEGKLALGGFERLIHLLEVPPDAYLDFETGGAGLFTVRIIDESGAEHTLSSHTQEAAGWQQQQISLATFAGQLVRLELHAPASAAWAGVRIAMPPAQDRPKPAPAQNVILLVVDALRSDHVPLYSSVYGASQAQMPNTESQAALGSVVFLHNQAASPSSPPSHGSIQTGMIPRVHGVDGDRGKIIPGTPTISTQVEKAGIASGYFGNNPFGMGRLEEPGGWTEFRQPGQEGKSNDCTTLVDMMLEFSIKQNAAGKRFFISSLPYETHTPYRYHEGISENYYDGPWSPPLGQSVNGDVLGALGAGTMTLSEAQWQQLKALYKGEAQYWDQCFATLVKGLQEAQLLDDTVLVLTSDHGEGMFEHKRMGHAFGHYRELGDVPFVLFWPKLAEGIKQISTVTSHRDIAPTILDLLGVPVDTRVQGQSVLPLGLRAGPWTARVVSLEYGRSYSLRSERYKLIADYNGLQAIYDLEADPWEQKDISQSGAAAVRYLRDMAGFFLEYRSQWRYTSWGTLNRHEGDLLQAAELRESAR